MAWRGVAASISGLAGRSALHARVFDRRRRLGVAAEAAHTSSIGLSRSPGEHHVARSALHYAQRRRRRAETSFCLSLACDVRSMATTTTTTPPAAADSIFLAEDAESDARRATLVERYNAVCADVAAACKEHGRAEGDVTFVAVSKRKPAWMVRALYALGHRDFGENYANEMIEKAAALVDLADIRWHFIGHLQSNKAKRIVGDVPALAVVETVDTLKLARNLNKAVIAMRGADGAALDVFLQVNTSGEASKSGVAPADCAAVYADVAALSHVNVVGLMTIGAFGLRDPNAQPDFDMLIKCRSDIAAALAGDGGNGAADAAHLQLSMGMSADFAVAIKYGSSNIRVGSSIFGGRPTMKSA